MPRLKTPQGMGLGNQGYRPSAVEDYSMKKDLGTEPKITLGMVPPPKPATPMNPEWLTQAMTKLGLPEFQELLKYLPLAKGPGMP